MEHTGGFFGMGCGPIHIDNVICSGSEYSLLDCQIRNNSAQKSHSEDVGVKCKTSKIIYISYYYNTIILGQC